MRQALIFPHVDPKPARLSGRKERLDRLQSPPTLINCEKGMCDPVPGRRIILLLLQLRDGGVDRVLEGRGRGRVREKRRKSASFFFMVGFGGLMSEPAGQASPTYQNGEVPADIGRHQSLQSGCPHPVQGLQEL